MKNSFLSEMSSRGFLNQCTDLEKLENMTNQKSISAYIGFDCTAPSLHVGSLLQIMILRLLQKHGHQPIVLLGGGTTLIGDPSGKDSTRKILKQKDIKRNIVSIKKIFLKLLNSKNKKTKPIFVDNYNWLGKLKYIEFLRDVGKHFTINKMLTFDSVKLRLEREQSLSYMEFNYMILQAYDFYQLFKKNNCVLQMGGSDQWGNIVNGVELVRRVLKKEVFGLTTPLITLSSGAKMGKTEKGAVWLDRKLFSPYDYWQFWRNTDDADVKRFLSFFTEIDSNVISKKTNDEKDINKLKILLANEATKILHGEKDAKLSENTAKETFHGKGVSKNLPEISVKKTQLEKGINILDLLSSNNVVSSKSEARRAIKGNGIKINDKSVTDEKKVISRKDLNENDFIKISYGKKKHFIIKSI
ncbi:MAG: tyrosine--tRNA ligase [Pelagibacteraceae bacterium TMED287]|nr:MAG: tyrosine--tRNA ligase [Pelagibacteraceae bacterium TMED287]|tara:strand:+ start:840 stop:2081 length:1242 start_codon:yes stop_codon:yes gene_type:complete